MKKRYIIIIAILFIIAYSVISVMDSFIIIDNKEGAVLYTTLSQHTQLSTIPYQTRLFIIEEYLKGGIVKVEYEGKIGFINMLDAYKYDKDVFMIIIGLVFASFVLIFAVKSIYINIKEITKKG